MKTLRNIKALIILWIIILVLEIFMLIIYLFKSEIVFHTFFDTSFLTILLTIGGAYIIFRLEIRSKKMMEKNRKKAIIQSAKNEVSENLKVSKGYKDYEEKFKEGIYYDIYYDFDNSLLQKLNENVVFKNENITKDIQESIKIIKIINRLVDLTQSNHPRRIAIDFSLEIEKFKNHIKNKKLKKTTRNILFGYLDFLQNIYSFVEIKGDRYIYNQFHEKKIRTNLDKCFINLEKDNLRTYNKIYSKFLVCDSLKEKFLLSLRTYLSIFQMNNQLYKSLEMLNKTLGRPLNPGRIKW